MKLETTYLWLMAAALVMGLAGVFAASCSSAPVAHHLNCEALEEPRDGALCLHMGQPASE